MSGRTQALLLVSVSVEGNKARQSFRWQPAHRVGGGSNRTCHLEGRWASGLLQEDQQLSVLSKLHSLLKMKMSWRQKEMPVMSFDLLVFPGSSFVSKTLFWQASGSSGQLFFACVRSQGVETCGMGRIQWHLWKLLPYTCLWNGFQDVCSVSWLFEKQVFLG